MPENKDRREYYKTYNKIWYQQNKKRLGQLRRAYILRTKYGLTPEDFAIILKGQEGKCAICLLTMKYPCVDHDHKTGGVRGLLCGTCNRALGLFKDNSENLQRAAAYIDELL